MGGSAWAREGFSKPPLTLAVYRLCAQIADVQRTIQRIEQSSGSPGEEDERTAALLSGLRLQEHLLLTRGKSEQPPVTEPPSKMAKRDAPALSRLPYHFTPVVDAKERLLSAAYAQDDSTSKLSASPELYPPELSSSKGFADASTASSTPESSPRVHADFSYAWPPAMPWYTAHDQQAAAAAALAAARYLGSVPQLSPTSADAAAAAAGRAARSTLAYQQQLWAAAHAQAQWYAAERAMRFYY